MDRRRAGSRTRWRPRSPRGRRSRWRPEPADLEPLDLVTASETRDHRRDGEPWHPIGRRWRASRTAERRPAGPCRRPRVRHVAGRPDPGLQALDIEPRRGGGPDEGYADPDQQPADDVVRPPDREETADRRVRAVLGAEGGIDRCQGQAAKQCRDERYPPCDGQGPPTRSRAHRGPRDGSQTAAAAGRTELVAVSRSSSANVSRSTWSCSRSANAAAVRSAS